MKIKKTRLLELIKEEIENLDEMMPLASFVPNTRKVPTDPEKAYGWNAPEVRDEIEDKFDKLAPKEQESLLRDLIAKMRAGEGDEGLMTESLLGALKSIGGKLKHGFKGLLLDLGIDLDKIKNEKERKKAEKELNRLHRQVKEIEAELMSSLEALKQSDENLKRRLGGNEADGDKDKKLTRMEKARLASKWAFKENKQLSLIVDLIREELDSKKTTLEES